MPLSRTPDPARSYALIIGASDYDADSGYEAVPTAARSADKVADLIRKPEGWALPARNVKVMRGRVELRKAAKAIEEAASRPGTDGLFLYICAHGRVFREDHVPDPNLHFAFADSAKDWSYTHLPFLTVKRMLTKQPKPAATMLIIDSCFAAGSFLGPHAAPLPIVPGVSTLISTKYLEPAHAVVPGSPYTAFSGALIDIFEQGISGPSEFLTANEIYEDLCKRLQPDHPEPDIRSNGSSVFLCQNPDYRRVRTSLSVAQLIDMLDRQASADTAIYATAIEDAHGTDQQAAARLVRAFGQSRFSSETIELAKALRSRGVPSMGEYADMLLIRAYACRPGDEVVELLHWHDREEIDVRQVLTVLREQPDRVTADVSAGLRAMDCADCAAISVRLTEEIPAVWPADRLVGLLSALY